MIAQFLSPVDSRWRQVLDRARHDPYQLPEYALVAARQEGADPVAFYAESGGDAVLIPLLIRELPTGLGSHGWDATSPYGFAGPVVTPSVSHTTLRAALAQFRELARQRGLVSAFLRLNPLRPVPDDIVREFATVVQHGSVVYIDLTKSVETLWAETRSNHRRNISRLTRLGYRVEVDDWSAYPAFRLLYRTTMQRRSAASFYFFGDEYFDEMKAALAEHLHLVTVRGPAGDVAAAGLFMLADGVVEYHLGGTDSQHLANAPSKLMFDFVRRWAKERGATLFNLGGGVGSSSDPLHLFKMGFSPTQAVFRTARFVFDTEHYDRLVAARGEPVSVVDDFFPAYRRPHAGSATYVTEPA